MDLNDFQPLLVNPRKGTRKKAADKRSEQIAEWHRQQERDQITKLFTDCRDDLHTAKERVNSFAGELDFAVSDSPDEVYEMRDEFLCVARALGEVLSRADRYFCPPKK